jgi:cell division protein FtsX
VTRKRLFAGAAVLVVVAVVGGTFALARDDSRERADCRVRVYFRTNASREEIRAVGDRLAAVENVSSRFVSKKEALEILRRRDPELVEGIPWNPLPASYDARTTYADSCSDLTASLRPRPPGVENVNSTVGPYEKSAK